MNTMRILLFGLAVLPLAGCAQGPQPAEAPPFKPVASVLDIMESLVGHMATDVFASVGTVIDEKGTHEIVPKDDEAWAEVRFAAMGLAETGNLLMFPTRTKDQGDWLMFSQQLVDDPSWPRKPRRPRTPRHCSTPAARFTRPARPAT